MLEGFFCLPPLFRPIQDIMDKIIKKRGRYKNKSRGLNEGRMINVIKKLGLLMLTLVTLANLSGCSTERFVEAPPPANENSYDIVGSEPQEDEVTITVYYANNDYIMTGDDSSGKIIPVEKHVSVGDKAIEEMIVAELQMEPGEEKLTTLLANLNVLSVDTVEGIAYVDISGEQLSGGSLMESMILLQLVYSLTELDEVEAVQVLVDGSKADSLMGHIEIREPLTREDVG